MTKSARVALWFAATLILVLCVLTALLIFPSRPADTHSLRFDGYIVLPKVKNSGALALLDYLTVFGDDLFVASVSTGAVYKIGLHTRAMPDSADVSVFESEPAAHGVVVDPTSHLAFVTRSDANTVDVFDPTNMRLVKRIPVAADPDGIFYEPSNQLVYVASSDTMLATLIDPASQDSIGTISLGGKPEFFDRYHFSGRKARIRRIRSEDQAALSESSGYQYRSRRGLDQAIGRAALAPRGL